MKKNCENHYLNNSDKNMTPGIHIHFRCRKFKKQKRCNSEKEKIKKQTYSSSMSHLPSHLPRALKKQWQWLG